MDQTIRYKLSPAQSEIFNSTSRFRVAACGRRFGKALALDTPILTTKGWSTMGALEIGQYVFTPMGEPTQIIQTSRIYENHEIFCLRFSNGEEIVSDAGHRWRVQVNGKHRSLTTHELSWLRGSSLLIEKHNFHVHQEGEDFELIGIAPMSELQIVEIRAVDSVPVRCIEVADKEHLFLCGETLIPTHNSYLSVFELLQAASIPNSQCWYVTSSYRAAKQIIWETLKNIMIPTGFVTKINESELLMRLMNKSRIQLKGADSSDSLRGVGLDFLVIDEAAFCEEKVWKEVLRPTLSDTGGSCLFISSPSGRDWFYRLWLLGNDPEFPDWSSWQFTTIDGGQVPLEEIEAAKRDLDERTFKQEYEAQFSDAVGVIYYNFDHDDSSSDYKVDMSKPFVMGIDMNIDPMSCVVGQKVFPQGLSDRNSNELHIVDEIVLYSSNTDELAQEIKNRYPVSLCTLYPDPACVQRKTSAGGKTDLSILQSAGFKVRLRNQHPPVRDRINAVNSLLRNSDGRRRLYINRKCRHLRESLSRQTYKENSSIPDKSRGFDHLCLSGDTKVLSREQGFVAIQDLHESGHIKDIRNRWVRYGNPRCTQKDAYVLQLTFAQSNKTKFKIICTPDHQFLTVHGFFPAEELRDGERMCKMLPHYKPPSTSRQMEIRGDIDDLLGELGPSTQQGLTSTYLIDQEVLNEERDVWCLFVPRYHHFQCGSLEYPILSSNCVVGSTLIKTPNGPIEISRLTDGMLVSTVTGEAPILGCQITGVKEIYEVKLSDGQMIECTADHKFLTQNGFVEAQHLTPADKLVCSSLWKKEKNISLTDCITSRMRKALTTIINVPAEILARNDSSIGQFMQVSMEKSLEAIMSITSTVTGKITQSKI